MNMSILYEMNILFEGVIFIVILYAALEAGYQFGRWETKKKVVSSEKEYKDLVLTAMYALLGLMLAFTYTFTLSRADLRKQALVDESNAIGTAFLRADMIQEPTSTELQATLLEYAKSRIIKPESISSNQNLKNFLLQTQEAQERIWPVVQQMLNKGEPPPVEVSVVQSINDVFDIGTKRLAVSFDRLPMILLFMLLFLAGTSLGLTGYNAGLSGKLNRGGLFMLVLFLTMVILMITDFDMSYRGFVKISQQSMFDVVRDMERMLNVGGSGTL